MSADFSVLIAHTCYVLAMSHLVLWPFGLGKFHPYCCCQVSTPQLPSFVGNMHPIYAVPMLSSGYFINRGPVWYCHSSSFTINVWRWVMLPLYICGEWNNCPSYRMSLSYPQSYQMMSISKYIIRCIPSSFMWHYHIFDQTSSIAITNAKFRWPQVMLLPLIIRLDL